MRLITAFSLLCVLAPSSLAQIIYVDQDNASGYEDGQSWATAFTTIQPAVDAAEAASGEIWMAEGTYDEARDTTGSIAGENLGSVLVSDTLEIYGGFTGSETLLAERNPFLNITTIDGSTARAGLPAHHVIHVLPGPFLFLLDGVHVVGGSAGLSAGGGGIYAHIANPGTRIRNSYFENNQSVDSGLGMGGALNASGAEVRNSVFRSNTARFGGSAINVSGFGLFLDCIFQENLVQELDDGFGGGTIISVGSSAYIDDCTFVNNVAPFGAGVASLGSADVIFRSSFVGNQASDQGGAIGFDSFASSPFVISSEFVDNTASTGGGAIVIFEGGSDVHVFGSSFENNSAGSGGGTIQYMDASPSFRNLAIGASSAPTLDGAPVVPEALTESVLPGGFPGAGNITADPEFAGALAGNLYLAETSPGIDDADAVFDETLLQRAGAFIDRASASFDIFGAPRPVGAGADMGAYEFIGDVDLCSTMPMIQSELDALAIAAGLDELGAADGLPGHASIALLKLINCTDPDFDPVGADAYQEAYHRNLAQMLTEPDAPALEPYRHALAALMLVSQDAQDAVRSVLGVIGLQLDGDYHVVFNDPSYGPRLSRASYLDTLNLGELAEVSGEGFLGFGGTSNAQAWADFVADGGSDPDEFAQQSTIVVVSENDDSGVVCVFHSLMIGTPLDGDIDRLRQIRDHVLRPLPFGEWIIDFYYAASPALILLCEAFPPAAWCFWCLIWLMLHPWAIVVLVITAAYLWRRNRQRFAGTPGYSLKAFG